MVYKHLTFITLGVCLQLQVLFPCFLWKRCILNFIFPYSFLHRLLTYIILTCYGRPPGDIPLSAKWSLYMSLMPYIVRLYCGLAIVSDSHQKSNMNKLFLFPFLLTICLISLVVPGKFGNLVGEYENFSISVTPHFLSCFPVHFTQAAHLCTLSIYLTCGDNLLCHL